MPQAKTTSANLYITCGDSSAPNYWRCSVSGCLNDPKAVSSILAEVAYFLYFTYRRKITFFLQKFIRQVQNCPSCEFWAVSTCQRLKIKHYDFWISRRKKFSVKKFGNLTGHLTIFWPWVRCRVDKSQLSIYCPTDSNARPKFLKSPAFIPLLIKKWPIRPDTTYVKKLCEHRPCHYPLCFTWMSHHFKNFQRERLESLVIVEFFSPFSNWR